MQVSCVTEGNFKKHKKSILRPKTRRPHFVKRLEPNVFLRHMAQNLTSNVFLIALRTPKNVFEKFEKCGF